MGGEIQALSALKGGGKYMIILTKLNGTPFVLNCDLIETIEENPDTTIRLVSKNFHIVRESMVEVVEKVIAYRCATHGEIKLVGPDTKEG